MKCHRLLTVLASTCCALLAVGVLWATPAGADAPPATAPATQPATRPAASKFPKLDELVARKKAEDAAEAAKQQVAWFSFDAPIVERPADFSWFGDADATTLRSVVTRLHKARDDKDLRAVLVTFDVGAAMNFAQASEIRDALADLRRAGKRVFVYADSYDAIAYTVASAATNICLLEAGEVMMPGIGLETMFFRGTMDKLGVTPDFIQIGEYKGAEEPYTRTKPSDELRGEMNRLVDSLFGMIVDSIAGTRGLSRDTVRRAIDDTMLTGEEARSRGFVDHLLDRDGLRELIETELGGEARFLAEYGAREREAVDWSNIFSVFKAMSKRAEPTKGPTVALIYAEGTIVDGEGEGSLFESGGVGSEAMRKAFRDATDDENIKAIVVRIDSPGGSALASEVMWQAARRAAKEKPVIISIGSMAASGGYYLASGGDYIFADPSAIIGSIGVVGGKFVLSGLYDKLGLTTETFSRGRNADLFSSSKVWDDRQRKLVRQSMQRVYDLFTQRVMHTRTGKIKDIDKVARGRIFLAREALDLGMVDELGGLEKAIAHAAEKASLEAGTYEVRVVPGPRTLADLLEANPGEVSAPVGARAAQVDVRVNLDPLLLAVPESARKQVVQQLQLMRLLEQRPVVLMAPFSVTIR